MRLRMGMVGGGLDAQEMLPVAECIEYQALFTVHRSPFTVHH